MHFITSAAILGLILQPCSLSVLTYGAGFIFSPLLCTICIFSVRISSIPTASAFLGQKHEAMLSVDIWSLNTLQVHLAFV